MHKARRTKITNDHADIDVALRKDAWTLIPGIATAPASQKQSCIAPLAWKDECERTDIRREYGSDPSG